MSFRPIFVLGVARSGTNLLARMLDRHSRIAIALDPLMPVFRSLRNAVLRPSSPDSPFQDFYFREDGPAQLDALLAGSASLPVPHGELQQLRQRVRERAALESPALAGRMERIEGASYQALLESALRIIADTRPGAAWVGCKEVWVLDFVPLLARAFPQARFYAIERDPRAIVASLLAMAEADSSQRAHPPSYMRHWRKNIALARRFAADPALAGRFRALSYERLVASPQAQIREICAELGVEAEPGMLALSADGWAGNSSYAHEDRDVYKSSSQRWRQSLAPQVLRTTDYLCGPEMALSEYREATAPAPEGVLAYLEQADRDAGSWRSGSGDSAREFEGELLRRKLIAADAAPDRQTVRRCFLFTETFDAIRENH
jgi:hypothetical protein